MVERKIEDANAAFTLDNTVDFMLLAKFSELECRFADAGRPISVDLEKLCRFANVVGKNTARYLEERMVLWLRSEHNAAVSDGDTARAETIDSLIKSQLDQRGLTVCNREHSKSKERIYERWHALDKTVHCRTFYVVALLHMAYMLVS